MNTESQMDRIVQNVTVKRRNNTVKNALSVVDFTRVTTAPLAIRLSTSPARTNLSDKIPPVRISLYEGAVNVNGRMVRIPVGVTGQMTGWAFKRLASIYRGHGLFIRLGDGSLRRIGDHETIEVSDGADFTHRPEPPRQVRTMPRFNRD